jgi:hypothetical protein
MKYFLTTVIVFINVIVSGQSFKVTIDTLDISVKDLIIPANKIGLTHAIEFKENYYCFFEEIKKDNSRRDIKFCFIIAKDGKILKSIKVPEDIQDSYYYDLFLKHDTIFVKTYMDSKTFIFNQSFSKWVKTKNTDDMIFEDERFYFTYLDFGEWGSTTWCKDKITGKEYEFSSGTIINKIDNAYYLTSGLKILKVENPFKLKECKRDYYYEIVRNKDYSKGSNSLKGVEVIFIDTTYSIWDQKEPKLLIGTSFVADKHLYHLCSDSINTFITKLENGQMKPIQHIDKKISIFNWYYSYRNKTQKDNSQLLKFNYKDDFGLVQIKGSTINIHFLNFK